MKISIEKAAKIAGAAMLLYMMVPMVTPLDSGIMNVILCFAAGGLICVGLGAVSCQVLKRGSLV